MQTKTRPRGRPSTWTDDDWRAARSALPTKTQRHRANWLYSSQVVARFADDPAHRFGWLCSDGAAIMRGEGHSKSTILAELGRVGDDQAMEELALYICEHQLPTREAVAFVRAVRLGRKPPSDSMHLADHLRTALNTYLQTHQPLTWEQVREALYELHAEVNTAERVQEGIAENFS